MWEVKKFKTQQTLDKWRETHGHKYQITEIFINNGYALEVRRLRRVH